MRQLPLLLLLLLFAHEGHAQAIIPPPFVFGKIPEEDIAMTSYEPDTSAAAVVLCHFGTVGESDNVYKFGYKFHKRIKILKRTGYDAGNIGIPFKSAWGLEEFIFGQAQVRLPSGDVVKLKKKDVFYEKLSDEWTMAKFTFPKLGPGCILEYEYELQSMRQGNLKSWYFQEDIPVKFSEFRIGLPAKFQYTYILQGAGDMALTDDSPRHTVYEGNGKRCDILSNRFIFKDVPAFQPEAYIASVNDCLVKIKFQLSELQFFYKTISVNKNWSDFKDMLHLLPWFGRQYEMPENTALAAAEILPNIQGAPRSRERAEAYYWYIANNMNWNHNYSFSLERMVPLDTIYQERRGSSGELNLLLLALLRRDSFEANPVLLSTRSNGRPYTDFPLIDQFDHMIVQVVVDSSVIIMDALDPLRPPNYPDMEALNGQGLLLKPDTAFWIPIVSPSDATDYYNYDVAMDENGHINGNLLATYRGYNAILERQHYKTDDTHDYWNKRMLEKFPGFEKDTLRHSDVNTPTILFNDTLSFKIIDAAQLSGDYLYFSPILFSNFNENMFKEEKRKFPIDFGLPFLEQYIMKLKLPPGYEVESLPKSSKIILQSNSGSYVFNIEQKGADELHINSRLQIKKIVFQPEEYPDLKQMMSLVAEKMGEQVVLKKK
ncbi:MAG: DUF3857 domain-containing protein [Bacteroidetes bacterium]|nr:DUF3857 domain-containing protein [Bacteroidota bacterium]